MWSVDESVSEGGCGYEWVEGSLCVCRKRRGVGAYVCKCSCRCGCNMSVTFNVFCSTLNQFNQ